jgi:hypothetical protein
MVDLEKKGWKNSFYWNKVKASCAKEEQNVTHGTFFYAIKNRL